jgi:hypothetical protein
VCCFVFAVILLKNIDPPHLVNGSRGVVVAFENVTEKNLPEDHHRRSNSTQNNCKVVLPRFLLVVCLLLFSLLQMR